MRQTLKYLAFAAAAFAPATAIADQFQSRALHQVELRMSEASAIKTLQSQGFHFEAADENQDGEIFQEEWRALAIEGQPVYARRYVSFKDGAALVVNVMSTDASSSEYVVVNMVETKSFPQSKDYHDLVLNVMNQAEVYSASCAKHYDNIDNTLHFFALDADWTIRNDFHDGEGNCVTEGENDFPKFDATYMVYLSGNQDPRNKNNVNSFSMAYVDLPAMARAEKIEAENEEISGSSATQ